MSEKKSTRTGLTWTGIAALFIVLRMMAVVHYDWHTAFSVADTIDVNDAITMMIGTAMGDEVISATALLVLLPLTYVHIIRMRAQKRPYGGTLVGLVTLLVFLVALVMTFRAWWLPPVAVLLALGLHFLLRERHRNPGGRAARWMVAQVGAITAGTVLVGAAVMGTPWVGLERIETTQETLYGYVLDTPPGYLKVLTAPDRKLRILESATVTGREEIER